MFTLPVLKILSKRKEVGGERQTETKRDKKRQKEIKRERVRER